MHTTLYSGTYQITIYKAICINQLLNHLSYLQWLKDGMVNFSWEQEAHCKGTEIQKGQCSF